MANNLGMRPPVHRPQNATTRSSNAIARQTRVAGKPKVLALLAVARKLITILNASLRDRRPWQPLPA